MKKLLLSLLVVLGAYTTACADGKSTVTTNPTVLPGTAQSFLKKYFSTLPIQQIKIEKKMIGREYEVTLGGGCEIEFNKKGEWTKIDCKRTAIPTAVIPPKITQYVSANFPNDYISYIEKDDGGYDIELSNDLDLKFNGRGEFLKYD